MRTETLIRELFCRVFCPCGHKERRVRVTITAARGRSSITFHGERFMFTKPDDSPQDKISIEVDDAKGFPTTSPAAPTFSSSDTNVATVDTDGVVTYGNPGTSQLVADFGDFKVVGDLTVVAGKPVGGVMTLNPVA